MQTDDRKLAVLQHPMARGCHTCFFRELCGGLDGFDADLGCLGSCGSGCADKQRSSGRQCDWTCPSRPDFWMRWAQVGWPISGEVNLRSFEPSLLPQYMPLIGHGGKRRSHLRQSTVAVSMFRMLRWYERTGQMRPNVRSGSHLRTSLRLEPESKVFLVSVAKDDKLETFWSRHKKDNIAERLRELDIIGITVPNFSFFDDAPRIHTLWNRWRMLRVAEHLSEAGIAVVPHLNALEPADWDFWSGFLRDHPHLTCVAKEFQTGNSKFKHARQAIDELQRLEQRLGRSLHPVLIGAGFVLGEIKSALERFTLIDSCPFMQTVHRRELIVDEKGARKWRLVRTPPGTFLDAKLERNVEAYVSWVARTKPKKFRVASQLMLRRRQQP